MRESPSSRRAPSRRAFIPLFLFGACLLGAGGTPPTAVPQPQTADNAVCPAYDASKLPIPLPASPTAAAGSIPGTFSVTSGGQAAYAMPLVLPPGRLGMEPKLSIAYDSSRGESSLGVGFALQGLSAITRCPANMAQDGRIRAVRNDTEDHFCIDGLRLVDIPNSQGHDGYHTREWRTFPDTQRKVISHDGPDFSKGPQHWAVYEKDGRLREYGATPDSQAMALHGTVAAWHLSSEVDRRGNAVDYTYQNDPYWEDGHTQELLIQNVRYTRQGNTPATRSVSFAYEPTAPSTLFSHGLWVVRSHLLTRIDVMTIPDDTLVRSYHLGYRTSHATQRTTLHSVRECAGDGGCKPSTRFAWSDNPPGFTPTITPLMVPPDAQGVQLDQAFGTWTMADVNGDGLEDLVVVYPNANDQSQDDWMVALNTGGAFAAPERWATLPHPKTKSGDSLRNGVNEENWILTPMDYDQDGITDILLDTPNPDAKSWPEYAWLKSEPHRPIGERFQLRVTGVPQPQGIPYLSIQGDPNPLKPSSNRFARVGDINGDGIGDLIQCVNPTWDNEGYNPTLGSPSWTVNLWVPSVPNVGAPGWDFEHPIPIPGTEHLDCASGVRHVHIIDIDGDGVSEIVMPQANGIYDAHRYENGTWVHVPTNLSVQAWEPGGNSRVVHWLDVNGDGLPDAMLTGLGTPCSPGINCENPVPFTIGGYPYDVPFLALNDGTKFRLPTGTLPTDLATNNDGVDPQGRYMTDWEGDMGFALDYDGDGRTDFMLPVYGQCPDNGSKACWVVLRAPPAVEGYWASQKLHSATEGFFQSIPTGISAVIDDDSTIPYAWFIPKVTDVDGDGRHDIVGPSQVQDGTFTIWRNSGPQDLLVSVTDGMSALDPGDPGFVPTVSIHYGTLIDSSVTTGMSASDPQRDNLFYLKQHDAENGCAYPRACVAGPQRVVDFYSLNDGQNEPRQRAMKYRDARYHRLGRGMLGFGDRIVIDMDTGAGVAEHYDNATWDDTLQVNPFAGQVVKSWMWTPASPRPPQPSTWLNFPAQVELVYTKTTLQEVPTDPSTFFTLPIVVEQVRREGIYPGGNETLFSYVREAQTTGSTLLGDTFSVVNGYDNFGNVLSLDSFAKGVDLDNNVTRIVDNDAERWLIGEVSYEETSSTALGRSAFRRTERTFNHYGEVTREVTGDPLDPDTQLTTAYHRDDFGNVALTTAYDEAGHYRSACTSYEPQGIFPYASVNQAGHTTLFDYDSGLGVLVGSVNPNGLQTRIRRDGFGRTTEERHADGSFSSYAISRHKDGGPKRHWWALKTSTNVGGGPSSTRELDSLGRPVRAWAHVAGTKSCGASKCESALHLEQATTYDHLGRVSRVTVPWMEGDALSGKHADTFKYDVLGRMTEHVEPWGRKTTYTYGQNVVTATDWLGTTKREVDALGRTVETTDKNGGTVKNVYGPWSLPHTTTRLGAETTTTDRDAYGRVVEEDDPDRGKTVTQYDGFGEVLAIDDAADRHFAFLYDGIGRLVERDDTVQGQTRSTQWAYDTAAYGVGKIAQMTSPDGHVDTYTYTPHSQLWRRTLTFEDTGESFETSLGYDGYGRVNRVHYPHPAGVDPLHVHRDYDAFGNVVAVRDDATGTAYWELGTLDGAGRPTEETLGNGVVVRHAFAPESGLVTHLRAEWWKSKTQSAALQDLAYQYDQGLRMTSRADNLQAGLAGPLTEGFAHDAIDRLTCAAVGGWLQTACAGPISYEDNGNIKQKDGLAYAYDPAHPHAVKTVGPGSYAHDGVGNQTQRPDGTTIAYTPFDLPESYLFSGTTNALPIGSTRFEYDGGQHRIRKTLVAPGGATYRETAYLDELYERVRDASGDTHRFYVPAGSAMVVLTRSAGGNDQAAYLLKDALGSVDVVTDGSGSVVERRSYDAFGARRNPQGWGPWQGALASAVTPVGFEGLEADDEAGLVNMRGRIYDPKLGRFLSMDPLVSHPRFAQSWNPYSYVLNSPLNFTDPSGFEPQMTATGEDGVTYATRPMETIGPSDSKKQNLATEHGMFAPAAAAPAAKDAGRDDTQAGVASNALSAATPLVGLPLVTPGLPAVPLGAPGAPAVGPLSAPGPFVPNAFAPGSFIEPPPPGAVPLRAPGVPTVPARAPSVIGGVAGGVMFILSMGILVDGDTHPAGPPQAYEIVPYRAKADGFQNHHGLLDKWQAENIPGYPRRGPDSPSMRLTIAQHERTKEVQRAWFKERTGKEVGGVIDWKSIDVRSIFDLSERMFDAAGAPAAAREAYYRAATDYVYRLEKGGGAQ